MQHCTERCMTTDVSKYLGGKAPLSSSVSWLLEHCMEFHLKNMPYTYLLFTSSGVHVLDHLFVSTQLWITVLKLRLGLRWCAFNFCAVVGSRLCCWIHCMMAGRSYVKPAYTPHTSCLRRNCNQHQVASLWCTSFMVTWQHQWQQVTFKRATAWHKLGWGKTNLRQWQAAA